MTARREMLNSSRFLAYKRLHAMGRTLGLDDDAYRDRLERLTGKRSAKELTDAELDRALSLFHGKQTSSPHAAKAKALWIAAWNLGVLASGNDAALDAFVKRQTGIERLAWLTPVDANKVTEALKAICARVGFVPAHDGIEARRQLLLAQWAQLTALKATMVAGENGLDGWLSHRIVPRKDSHTNLRRHELDAAAVALGRWIRRVVGVKPAPGPEPVEE